MVISIVGTGNLASHLAQNFEREGIRIAEIYGRDKSKAISLAAKLYDCEVLDELNFAESVADIIFLCVSDDSIIDVVSKIVIPENTIVVHSSGAKSRDILDKGFTDYHYMDANCGVFYPLMTFSKGVAIDFKKIPLCIEANNKASEQVLVDLAKVLSEEIYLINSKERLALHVAAVFSCNFVNHMWAVSKEILEEVELDFSMLKPLLKETFKKAIESEHPAKVQTGPALRNDDGTIKAHLDFLSDDEDLFKVYKTISSSIKDWHQQ